MPVSAPNVGEEPPYMCELFAALSAQLKPEQQGELEVIRVEVIKLRAWGREMARTNTSTTHA